MNQFYNYQPGKDDAAGNAMKNAYAGNMVQSGFNSAMAKDMATHQTALSQQTMTHAADLELRNTGSLMDKEHGFNMTSMGAQYDYQNQYADNQVGRDVTKIGAGAEAAQATDTNKITQQGQQDAINRVTQGEQDRLTDTNKLSATGKEDRATDTNKIETQGKANQAQERTRAFEERKTATHAQRIKSGNRNEERAIANQAARSF